jgi:hypothetical protein
MNLFAAACGPPRPALASQDPGHHTRRPIGRLSPDPSGGPLLAACTCAPGTPSAASPGRFIPWCGAGCSTTGRFYRSALLPLLRRINAYLMRWLRKKYKRLASAKKARACWKRVTAQYPRLFAHWAWVPYSWWSGWQEPDDRRLSSPDLWWPEVPPGYPT